MIIGYNLLLLFSLTRAHCTPNILRTIIVPQWFTSGNFLDCPSIENDAKRGVCDAVVLTLSTGYAVGCIVALVLNAILPAEHDEDVVLENVDKDVTKKLKEDDSSSANNDAGSQEEA